MKNYNLFLFKIYFEQKTNMLNNLFGSRKDQVYDNLLEGGNDSFMSDDPDKKVYANTFQEHLDYIQAIENNSKALAKYQKGTEVIQNIGGNNAKQREKMREIEQQRKANIERQRLKFKNKGYVFWLNGEELKYAKTSTFYALDNKSRFRFFLVWVINQKWFDFFIIGAILINSILMGAKNYTDFEDKTPINKFIVDTNPIFNTIIYIECVLKIIAQGFYFGQYTYLSDSWNWLDLFVVTSSLMNDIMSTVSSGNSGGKGLSALRAVRLLRPLKLLSKIPAIKVLISTLLSSIAGLSGIMGLAMFFFSIFSILGITIWCGRIHYRCYVTPEPVDGEWELLSGYVNLCSVSKECPAGSYCRSRFEARNPDGTMYSFNNPNLWADTYIEELFWGFNNFDNIGFALLTVFQVTTMDGWTVIMNIYENAGSQSFSWVYYISCVIVCSFFILNLTVAQMIMKYDEISSQQQDDDPFEQELKDLAQDIFEDDQQDIVDFIIKEDKAQLAPGATKFLSKKQSFIQSFFTAQKVVINEESKYYRNSIVKQCLSIVRSKHFNGFIIIVIIMNTIALSMDKYPEYPDEILKYFSYLNIAFTVVFTMEAAVKLIALGIRPFFSEGFNVFDLFIVASSIFQIYLEYSGQSQKGGLILILRTLRVFRIFKLFKVGDLRMLIDSITYTIPVIGPYVILLSFFMYIFALVAMSFYAGQIKFDDNGNVDIVNGTTVRENYNDLMTSFMTIFQVLMGAEWRFIWYQHMLACGMTASLYYIALHIIIGIIMLNLFLAIMLGNFDKARSFNQKKQIFDAFRELLHEREDMYSLHDVCDIVLGDMSDHAKFNVLKLSKPINQRKRPLLPVQMQQIDEEQEPLPPKDSYFKNYSLGIFHIDNRFRRACLVLSVEKSTYQELIRQREIEKQAKDPNNDQQLTAKQLDFQQRKLKAGTDWYKIFDNIVLVLICISSMMLPIENPVSDPNSKAVIYAKNASVVFSIFFLMELMIKIIGKGFMYSSIDIIEPYMASGWNRVDAFVVLISIIDLIYILSGTKSQFAALKAMRALRALRPLRVIRRFDNLRVVVNALLSTIGAINNVMLVGFLLLLMFAVMGINLLKGALYSCSIGGPNIVTKEDCLKAGGEWVNNDSNFDNIIQAMRTLFILCTTEGWAGLMFMGVDSMGAEMQPVQDSHPLMAIYFVIVMITGSLFIMNMFIGVVIDNFNKIKEKEELGSSYVTNEQRQWLIYQQIGQQKQLRNKIMEPVNFRKYFFRLVHHPMFDNFITVVVATNTVFLAIKSYQMSPLVKIILKYANYVFAVIFNLEMILKLCAIGKQYFISSWNKFDMFIVITADIGIILDVLNLQKNFQTVATILRAFRIVRVVKLLQKFRSIKIIIDSTLNILPSITNVLSLLALITYVYACFGIYLFAGAKRRAELDSVNNFSSFGRAMLGLVRYSTGEDFQEFMYEFSQESDCVRDQTYEDIQINGYQGCGSWLAIPYFVSFQVIAGWLILNLTIAAVIDGLAAAQADEDRLFKSSDIDDFLDLWQEYDHHATGTISLRRFYLFLAELKPPFGTGAQLTQKYDPLTHNQGDKKLEDKDYGYMFNPERKIKVKKGKLLLDIIDLQLNVSLSAEDEILIEFSEAYKGLIKRKFKHEGIEKFKLQDEKANKKLIKGWQKKKQNDEDQSQTAVSKEDKDYLTQYLATMIIQEYYRNKPKKGEQEQNKKQTVNKRREGKKGSELVILEPYILPQNISKSIEDEYHEFKNQKAKKVFLAHCNRFALNKIQKEIIMVQEYTPTKADMRSNLIDLNQFTNRPQELLRSHVLEESCNCFRVESIKTDTDVVFVNNKLVILVKAWQKIVYQPVKDSASNDPKQAKKKKFAQSAQRTMTSTNLNFVEQKPRTFYVKTLQFFDYKGNKLQFPKEEQNKYEASEVSSQRPLESPAIKQETEEEVQSPKLQPQDKKTKREMKKFFTKDPILVEFVNDVQNDQSFYDISFLHHQTKIFYFKRIFNQEAVGLDGDTRKSTSRLQLFSFDLERGLEEEVSRIQFKEEKTEEHPMILDYNIIFSKPFGKSHQKSVEITQDEFLDKQFILAQKYQVADANTRIMVVKLKNCTKDAAPQDQAIKKSNYITSFQGDMNYQAVSINHKEFYRKDQENIYFVVTNMLASVEFKYSKTQDKLIGSEIFQRDDTLANSQYVWTQSEIKIQGMDIKSYNDDDEQETVEQYFFVDPRNQIQIIFPNHNQKAHRHKIKRLIMEQTNIKQLSYLNYKKIQCLSYNCDPYHGIECLDDDSEESDGEDCHHRYHNVVQKIEDLTAILDYDVIFKDHQLTYCNSMEDQILFISEKNSKQITLFSMNKNKTIDGHHSACKKNMNRIGQGIMVTYSEKLSEQNMSRSFNTMSKFRLRKNELIDRGKNFLITNQNQQSIIYEEEANQLLEEQQLQEMFDEQHFLSKLDLKEEYINDLDQDSGLKEWNKLKPEEKLNHVIIEDFKGKHTKIKVFEISNLESDSILKQRVKLIKHQPSSLYACFVFALYNIKEKKNDRGDVVSRTVVKQYIFVTKNNFEMNIMFTEQKDKPLIDDDDEVLFLKSSYETQLVPWHVVRPYQLQDLSDVIVHALLKDDIQNLDTPNETVKEFRKINLTFTRRSDKKLGGNQNFIPFIYQESQNTCTNSFICFDIFKQRMTAPINISPSNECKNYVYTDEQGYNSFQLCRTSDIEEEVIPIKSIGYIKKKLKKQMVRYAFYFLYSEKIGRLQGEEFLITHSKQGMLTQTVGHKEIILSKKIIELCEWASLKDSTAQSYQIQGDQNDKTKQQSRVIGSKLIFQVAQEEVSEILILDEDQGDLDNKQYTHQSDVVLAGHRKFQLFPNDKDQYVIVVTCKLRSHFISGCRFTRDEAYYILQQTMKNMLTMRICTLDYLMLNTFEDMKKDSFFQSQEILLGKSICDICLNDTLAVQEALRNRKEDDYNCNGSIMDQIVSDDQVRKQTFKEIQFYPKTMIIHYDLNLVGTVERAIYFKYFITLRMILDHIFDEINTNDYNSQIMNALPAIISQKQVNINQFFRMSQSDKKDRDKKTFCNIENRFLNYEPPIFSNKDSQYIVCSSMQNFHDLEEQLAALVINRERQTGNLSKNFIVEHTFIDFTSLIIGEKIRNRWSQDVEFNDIYLSQLFLKFGNLNKTTYQQDSVQKIIDYQWVRTRQIMKCSFFIYVLFYCLPISLVFFTQNEYVHNLMLRVALIPALLLFLIELIQIQEQGLDYFSDSWNNCDFSQFIIFIIIFILNQTGIEDTTALMPELRILLVILSLIKLMFFLRVFEEYGFLVQIVMVCCIDLIPFFTFFMVFLFMFSITFIVLGAKVDSDNDQNDHIGFFERVFIETFRSSIGEVGIPSYHIVLNKPDSWCRTLNLYLIWILWFAQIFFMLIIMLNFLIAVMQQSYNRVMNYQKIILYQQRAELNEECYNLVSIFVKIKSFKYIVFSTNKDIIKEQDHNFAEFSDIIQQYVTRDKKAILQCHDEVKSKMKTCYESQKILENKIEKNFEAINKKYDVVHRELREMINQEQSNQN